MSKPKVLVPMCRACLEDYGWPLHGIMIFDDSCVCCGRDHITVFHLSGDQIDKLNGEEKC